jgi:carbamoyltransferase
MQGSLLGPEFSNRTIERTMKRYDAVGRPYTHVCELAQAVAARLAEGKVVGWFQGRMEFGPRALGARSLLGDPRNPRMKDIINAKVKFREAFRPFAPAILREHLHDYFEAPPGMDMPFMLLVPKVRPEKRETIPAVTHQDGTGRVQTVTEQHNRLYYRLIRRFHELTGVPVLINTSFNVRGEPIVCTPRDAYRTFVGTGIDVLVIGHHLVTRKPASVDFHAGMERSVKLEKSLGTPSR